MVLLCARPKGIEAKTLKRSQTQNQNTCCVTSNHVCAVPTTSNLYLTRIASTYKSSCHQPKHGSARCPMLCASSETVQTKLKRLAISAQSGTAPCILRPRDCGKQGYLCQRQLLLSQMPCLTASFGSTLPRLPSFCEELH